MDDGSLELVRQIGEGGHSVVFLARRHGGHGFQRLVAVKVVRRDPDLPSIVNDRFLHEARLLGMLRHRGIVTADNVVELSIGTAIVMEYVPGFDLSDVARLQAQRLGRVPLGWLVHVGLEVSTALQAAWTWPSPVTGAPLRVLHCDVKPSNVRVTSDGAVKLLDFGVSTSSIDDTTSGPLMGTIAYAAPERALDGKTLPAGDLFSLGLTLLAVARGRPMRGRPLRPESFQEWVEHAIQTLRPEFSPLRELLRDLTSVEPESRPSHSEVRERLFELFRLHASQPPSDVSESLIQMIGREGLSDSTTTQADKAYVPATTSAMPSISLPVAPSQQETLPHRRGSLSHETPTLAEISVQLTDTGVTPLTPEAYEVLEHASLVNVMRPPQQLGPGGMGKHPDPPEFDETLIHELQAAPLPPAESSDLARLVATWFTGVRPEGSISHGDATQLLPPVELLAPLAAFGGWFSLDASVAVLETATARQYATNGVVDAIHQMLSFGWLEPRRDGVVPALRVSKSRAATASHGWARLTPQDRTNLLHRARAAMVAPFLRHTSLLDAAWGAGPGPTLAHDLTTDLVQLESQTPLPRELCTAAALAGRTRKSFSQLEGQLRTMASDQALSGAERRMLLGWTAHTQQLDPWAPVGELMRQLQAQLRSPAPGASRSAQAWYAAMLTRAARQSGARALAQGTASTALRQLGSDPPSTATALLLLEQAELAMRDEKLDEVMALCSRARSLAQYSFVDLIAVRALCLEAQAFQERGDANAARERAARAVRLADSTGCQRHLAESLTTRGIVALLNDATDEAIAHLTEAAQQGFPNDIGQRTWTLAWLSGAQLRKGQIAQARDNMRHLDPETDGLPPEVLALVRAWDARLATLLHEPAKAAQAIRSATAARVRADQMMLPAVLSVLEEADWLVSTTKAQ